MFAKKRTLSIAVVVALVVSMMLSACTSAPKAATSKYPGTKEAGTAIINLGSEPPMMNSLLTTDTTSGNVFRHICTGLTVLDKNDKAVSGVAKDWTISKDKLVYTFNLRKDFKWSNGEPVTAKDFEFAFKAILDPKYAAPYSYLGFVFKNGLEFSQGKAKREDVGVKVLDDYKLEITLAQPTPYLLDMFAFPVLLPVNQKAYEAAGDKYGTDANKMAYNGAYIISEWAHEDQIVLTKNPDYPDAKNIKIDKIVMKMIKDSNTAMNTFRSNQIDMIGLNGDQLKMMNDEKQPVGSYDDGGNWYFEYNLKDKALSNKKLRQALTYAIDSKQFVEKIVKNSSRVANSFTSPVIQGNKKKFIDEVGPLFKSHDVEKAKSLLEEVKKELGVDKISVSILCDDTDTAQKHAAVFQEAWKKDLGIEVKVDVQPFKSRIAKMQAKDFQMVLAGWGPDYNDPMTFLDMFETGNGNNHTSYTNPAYDALLNKVRVEADRDKRFGYLMDLEKILMDDMPIGPFYFRTRDYTTSAKLTGVVRTAFQDINLLHASVK